MNREIYRRNVDTRDELLARVLDAAARIMNREISSDEKHAIFVNEWQNSLMLTVGLSNI